MRLQEFFFSKSPLPPPHPYPPQNQKFNGRPLETFWTYFAVTVTHNALLNMLPNQAARPCGVHIGFEVADRMKSNEHYEQHKIKT